MVKKKQSEKGETSTGFMDLKGQRVDLKTIMKDVENFVPSYMTWKERKELENKKVASLGGKPPKKHRLPLSIARVEMKKQKERDEKMLQEQQSVLAIFDAILIMGHPETVSLCNAEKMILGRFGMKQESSTKKVAVKRKPEDRVLKSTVGHFRDGVLDVKELLKPPSSSRGSNGSNSKGGFIGFGDESFSGPGGGGKGKGKKKKGGKKKNNKKGGGRKRH